MNIEFELPHGIAQDLSRIADSLDTIVAIMRGQHTQPIPVAIKSMPACESKAPEIEPQPSLPGAEETQTPPADTEVPAKPRKAAKHAKAKDEEAPEEPTPATETQAPTLEDMRAALGRLTRTVYGDYAPGRAILARFGAKIASDVPPGKYAEVIAICEAQIAEVVA